MPSTDKSGNDKLGAIYLTDYCLPPSPLSPGLLFRFSRFAALRSSGGARRLARRRSLHSAALALAAAFSLAWAAGQQQHGGRFSVFPAKH